jgi:hypothetical protein
VEQWNNGAMEYWNDGILLFLRIVLADRAIAGFGGTLWFK